MKSTRIATLVVASSLIGGLAATAAGAAFNDVPTESRYAEHVTNVQQAGIATGFRDGSFRPTEPLNRQQAATWIDRAASRSALDFADLSGEFDPLTPADPDRALATVEMTSPATGSGGGWVTLQGYVAAASGDATGAGCPCALDVEVVDGDGDVVALSVLTAPGPESDDERQSAGPVGIAPLSGIVFLPGGTSDTYTLVVHLVDSDVSELLVAGTLSANYAPMAEGEPTPLGGAGTAEGPTSLVPRG